MTMNLTELWDDTATTAVEIDLDAKKAQALLIQREELTSLDTPDAGQLVRIQKIDEDLAKLKPGTNVLVIHVKTPLNSDRMTLALVIQQAEQSGDGWNVLMGAVAKYIDRVDGQDEAIAQAGGMAIWLRRLKRLALQKAIVDAVTDSCLIPEPDAKN